MRQIRFPLLLILALGAALSACAGRMLAQRSTEGARATLAILESTDTHSNILSFDYYKLADDPSLGFERMASLVQEARKDYENTLLFDAGDTIQGTALADWQAGAGRPDCSQELAMYKAMDVLGYDAGTIGNHEFNYGLSYLSQVTGQPMAAAGTTGQHCKGPGFPLVLANVVDAQSGEPIFPPTVLLERTLHARNAQGEAVELPIRIGVIGLTPPNILLWDRINLEGRVKALGVVETAERRASELRAAGADLVVAILHGGIDTRPYSPDMENTGWHLAGVKDVDFVLLGHSHQRFPDPGNARSRYNDLPAVDNQRGFLRGKPAVMGQMWGKSLGLIELALVQHEGRWHIDPAMTHAEVRSIQTDSGEVVDADPRIRAAVASEHAGTIAHVSSPIGNSDFPMTTYFAAVGDVSALQPVNSAQRAYVEAYVKANLPQWKDLPVLSAAAPFKAGFGGGTDFTDVPAGSLAIRNAGDLYLYPNTLSVLKLSGADLKGWLERSAMYFNQIDPALEAPQALVNRKVPSYNFDVIQGGIRYAIDISKPVGQRIVDLRFDGKPIDPAQAFLLATNNYRASGGGGFPGSGGEHVIFNAPDANRDILIDWIRQRGALRFESDAADRPWRFVALKTRGPIEFTSATGKQALAERLGLRGVREHESTGNGLSRYTIDLGAAH